MTISTKYRITSNQGMVPNQIEGVTGDGKYFYFRARNGYYELMISRELSELYASTPVFEGELYQAGYMTPEEFEALFWDVVDCYENGRQYPQHTIRQLHLWQSAFNKAIEEIRPRSTGHTIPVHEVIEILERHKPDRLY